MRTNTFTLIFFTLLTMFVFSCSKQEEIVPVEWTENQFVIRPEKPVKYDDLKLISYDCSYNQLFSIKKEGFNIEVIKHFNGMLKWPCILRHDTISLGKQAPGTYRVKLLIVDTSPMIPPADSIFHSEEKIIVVKE